MEAKESLCIVLNTLTEIEQGLQKDCIIDFLQGKLNPFIEENELDDLESFGIGENKDESFWEQVLAQAVSEGYLHPEKEKKQTILTVSPAGKDYLKSPTSFLIEDESSDESEEQNEAKMDSSIEHLMEEIANEPEAHPAKAPIQKKALQKIALIHAIDNKKDLDDFANSQGIDFLDVLDELESIIQQGMKLNIDYFIEEVLEDEQVDEIIEAIQSNKGDVKHTIEQLENSYSEDEVRLVYVKYLTEKKGR